MLQLYIYGSGGWAARVINILKFAPQIEIVAVVGSNKEHIHGYIVEQFSEQKLVERASEPFSCIYFCSHPAKQWRYFVILLNNLQGGRLKARLVLEKPICLNSSNSNNILELCFRALKLGDDLRMHSAFYWDALYRHRLNRLGIDGVLLHFRDGGNSNPHTFDSLLDWAMHSVICVLEVFVIERGLRELEFTLQVLSNDKYKIFVMAKRSTISVIEVGELDQRERSITSYSDNSEIDRIDFLDQRAGTIPAVFIEPRSSRSTRSFLLGIVANQVLLELRKKRVCQFSLDKYLALDCSDW